MEYLITFLASAVEWLALLSFPILLLGYSYKKYLKYIVLLAGTMSLFSMALHRNGE